MLRNGVVLVFLTSLGFAQGVTFDREALHAQAVRESLTPIRPGLPGKRPFWNVNARRFIWAPAFDFPALPGAERYRFTATVGKQEFSFMATKPWAPLTPIWRDLPVGNVSLVVTAIGGPEDKVLGVVGRRKFYRGATFAGPYNKPALDYVASARLGLEALMRAGYIRKWLTMDRPIEYKLYQYPAKMVSAVVRAGIMYSKLRPMPSDADVALRIARNAADYLLSISFPAGASALEYFPPTYRGGNRLDNNPIYLDVDANMLIYPAGVGGAYLDLYEVTGDSKYFLGAKRIADTYRRLQLPNGTWYLLVFNRTGLPKKPNFCHPTGIASFFRRLVDDYHLVEYRGISERAMKYLLDGPVRTFNWEGQFEDVDPSRPYRNLQKGTACSVARFLLKKGGKADLDLAEEAIRFAEDQFVVWERPFSESKSWFTPSALEQYRCYTPVNASTCDLITVYLESFKVTGDRLKLAKAISLANTLTLAQHYHGGRYPTWLNRNKKARRWINCEVKTIEVLRGLGEFLRRERAAGKL